MRKFIVRLINIVFGLFLYALGDVITLKASIGYSPWDVFHAGLSKITGLSIGTMSIGVGLVIILIVLVLGEKIGMGTVLNMILIGSFMDLLLKLDFLPKDGNLPVRIIMLVTGLFIIAVGSYFYIKSGFGAGPRDSLMVSLTRKTKFPIGVCRSAIELSVTALGWFLGGMVGIGTVISIIGIGFCIQIVFHILKFDPKEVKHETFAETINNLKTGFVQAEELNDR